MFCRRRLAESPLPEARVFLVAGASVRVNSRLRGLSLSRRERFLRSQGPPRVLAGFRFMVGDCNLSAPECGEGTDGWGRPGGVLLPDVWGEVSGVSPRDSEGIEWALERRAHLLPIASRRRCRWEWWRAGAENVPRWLAMAPSWCHRSAMDATRYVDVFRIVFGTLSTLASTAQARSPGPT